jgi:hypothetical protein
MAIEFTATIVTGDPEFKETESRVAVLGFESSVSTSCKTLNLKT